MLDVLMAIAVIILGWGPCYLHFRAHEHIKENRRRAIARRNSKYPEANRD
jgi:hypothetical protein